MARKGGNQAAPRAAQHFQLERRPLPTARRAARHPRMALRRRACFVARGPPRARDPDARLPPWLAARQTSRPATPARPARLLPDFWPHQTAPARANTARRRAQRRASARPGPHGSGPAAPAERARPPLTHDFMGFS